MDINTLDKLSHGADIARGVSMRLRDLAESFRDTGNSVVAKRLADLSEDLREAHRLVEQGRDEALAQAAAASEQATLNMIGAALATAKLANEPEAL